MPISFNADEILAIAEEIERNGRDFYRLAAGNAQPGEAKELLTRLADWEDAHEKTFHEMRERFAESGDLPESFDPDGISALYLQSIADGKVFLPSRIEKEAAAIGDGLIPVLEHALAREKDTVTFYQALKDMVPESLGREEVEGILQEELGHVTMITIELTRLTDR